MKILLMRGDRSGEQPPLVYLLYSFQLADKIQPGGYQIPGSVPTKDRASNVKENFETDKAKMDKKVMDQHMGRFESFHPADSRFRKF